ncbi:hypothetical protein RvY_00774 [Ramazzottius varieornatus]|uniref:C-type lectin domain-containing protein n=1 Tax=Ramazzottius varieornatus TaxID=947166 RepID=A0A1D1UEV0_RAMVA|nr:hypothetical protein RvY_00774 [Ramazzottius varieornatus]
MLRRYFLEYFLLTLLVLLQLHCSNAQQHHNCPLGCKCDFENGFKRVRCEVSSSSVNINFNELDSDIQFLEVLPRQRGRTDAFGPSLPDAFGSDFPQLRRLVIRNNGIQRIPVATARQLGNLITLDLVGNDIKDLRDLSLDNFPKLETLQLSNNGIAQVSDELRALRDLKQLALNTNQIRSISSGAFNGLPFLERIELRNNRLQDLPSNVFDSNIRLNYIDLRSNELTTVPRGVQSLLGLVSLLLDDNKISTVPGQLVQAWRSSEVLDDVSLFNNPLQCDDSLNEYVTWTKTSDGFKKACDVSAVRGQEPTSGRAKCPVCAGPRSFAGQTVDAVDARGGPAQSDRPSSGSSDRFAIRDRDRERERDRPSSGSSSTDFVSFQVVDSPRAPANFNPRRDTSRPGITRAEEGTLAKLKQYMPGAGVRCGREKCYFFNAKGTREWSTAEFTCQNIGLDLVEIASSAEQKEVMSFLVDVVKEDPKRSSMSRGWWIGFKYDPRQRAAVSATTGRTASFTNWAQGQPNNFAPREECVEMWDTGDWADGQCTLSVENQFICQSSLSVGRGLASQNTALRGDPRRSPASGSSSSGGGLGFDTVSFTVIN